MRLVSDMVFASQWYALTRSSTRQSWVELVCEFVTRYGFVVGFCTKGLPMSRMTCKLKTYVVKVFEAAGRPIPAVSRITHLRDLFGGDVAGLGCGMRANHRNHVWATLVAGALDPGKRPVGQQQANCRWIPAFLP